jgi:tRNA U38,U39,U40 pseudouridine synthase TruA
VVNGIIIHTKAFPGWEDFSAFQHHMKFVKDHHRRIRRVAVVTDSKLGSIVPNIARHFVSADIKHFEYEDMESAKTWIKGVV